VPTRHGPGLADRVRALAPDGVDGAVDTAGKGSVRALVELTGDPAKVVTIADFGAAELGVQVTGGGGGVAPRLEQVAELLASGGLLMRGRGHVSARADRERLRGERERPRARKARAGALIRGVGNESAPHADRVTPSASSGAGCGV
jgi:hypothetical protein